MRCTVNFGKITLIVAILSSCAKADSPQKTKDSLRGFSFFEPVKPARPVQVMAHRGLMRVAPENTEPAIERCVADYIEWAEVDVRLSKDGIHVLAHDATLDGKADVRGPVSEQTIEQLQSLDAGSWFARRYAGVHMLTLGQALRLAKGRINLYLDCKAINPAGLARDVLDAGMERQVIVYGDLKTIAAVREHSRQRVPVMAKWHPGFGFGPWLDRVQPAAVEIDAEEVTPEACRAFHERGIKVQAQTLGTERDRSELWSRVIAAGVDWIQTDLPHEVILQSLRSRRIAMPVKVAFHRGASRLAPENTLPAIEKAVAMGADYIEVDIRTSSDNQFFLLHDAKLERTTNGKGALKALSAQDLTKLDAGSWFGRPFAGTPVPTLDQALGLIAPHSHAYLDAKDIAPEALLALMEKHQLFDRSVVYQGSEYLKCLKALNSRVRTLPPLHNSAQLDRLAAELHPYGVDVRWTILSKELIEKCHALGIRVFSDAIGLHETINDYTRAMEWGIDVIQTDHPARVWRAIELRGQNPEAGG